MESPIYRVQSQSSLSIQSSQEMPGGHVPEGESAGRNNLGDLPEEAARNLR